MSDYKLELLIEDPNARQELIESLIDCEVYEQTNFDGKRFVEIWLKPASDALIKAKDVVTDFARQRKISTIKITDGKKEVHIESIHPEDLEKVDSLVESVFERIDAG